MKLSREFQRRWRVEGYLFEARVSPHSWLNPQSGFQVYVRMTRPDGRPGGSNFYRAKVFFARATVADFDALLDQIETTRCPGCGGLRIENGRQMCRPCALAGVQPSIKEASQPAAPSSGAEVVCLDQARRRKRT